MKINAYNELKQILKEIKKSEKDIKEAYLVYKLSPVNFIEIDNIKDLKKLKEFYYDNGYGMQFLKGYILFNDSTWLERREYDGKEWWEYKSPEIIEELINNKNVDFYDYF